MRSLRPLLAAISTVIVFAQARAERATNEITTPIVCVAGNQRFEISVNRVSVKCIRDGVTQTSKVVSQHVEDTSITYETANGTLLSFDDRGDWVQLPKSEQRIAVECSEH